MCRGHRSRFPLLIAREATRIGPNLTRLTSSLVLACAASAEASTTKTFIPPFPPPEVDDEVVNATSNSIFCTRLRVWLVPPTSKVSLALPFVGGLIIAPLARSSSPSSCAPIVIERTVSFPKSLRSIVPSPGNWRGEPRPTCHRRSGFTPTLLTNPSTTDAGPPAPLSRAPGTSPPLCRRRSGGRS